MAFIPLLTSLVTQATLSALVICFTAQYSLWRPAVVPIVVFCTYQAWLALDFFNNNQLVNPMTAAFVVGFGLHHVNLVYVTRIHIEDVQKELIRTNAGEISTSLCLRRTFYLLSTLRGIDTPYEIKTIRHGKRSSRLVFLLHTVTLTAAKYLVLDLMTVKPQSPEDITRLFGPGKEILLPPFRPNTLPPPTLQEILINLAVAFMGWGPIGSLFIDVHYRVLAIISVALGVSSPHQWPPLFGSIIEAYTLRRFWGKFWHQSFRWPMQSLSSYLCRIILRLPHPSLVERYLNISCVFVISAFLHVAIDGRAGIYLPYTGALRCFLIQPVGIIFEDAAQELYRRTRGGDRSEKWPMWTRVVGYIWVWGFLTLVAPLYNFPLFRYQDPTKNAVPFSVIKWVTSRAS